MTQLEVFTEMIDGLPRHIRNTYSPTTRVVDSELPQETRFTLNTGSTETQFVFSREGKLVDIMQRHVSHPEIEPDSPEVYGPKHTDNRLGDIIDQRWRLEQE